jgi:hypothetical protein
MLQSLLNLLNGHYCIKKRERETELLSKKLDMGENLTLFLWEF